MDGDAAEGATGIALVARRPAQQFPLLHWSQLLISEPRGRERGRLALRSHGKEVQFGMFLKDEQLAATARRLKEHLNIR